MNMKKLRPGEEVICPESQVMPETEAEAQYSLLSQSSA